MKSGETFMVSEECDQALQATISNLEGAYSAFEVASKRIAHERKNLFRIIRENHPELEGHEFSTDRKDGKIEVTVMWHDDGPGS